MRISTTNQQKFQQKISLYLGVALFVLGSVGLISDTSSWYNIPYLLAGIINICTYFFQKKYNYCVFSDKGILAPRFFNLLKPKFLAFKDLTYANYKVGDYVFRNTKTEFRFPKELLSKDEIEFLEKQMLVLQKQIN